MRLYYRVNGWEADFLFFFCCIYVPQDAKISVMHGIKYKGSNFPCIRTDGWYQINFPGPPVEHPTNDMVFAEVLCMCVMVLIACLFCYSHLHKAINQYCRRNNDCHYDFFMVQEYSWFCFSYVHSVSPLGCCLLKIDKHFLPRLFMNKFSTWVDNARFKNWTYPG